ncbi:DUF7322 domain-containing protein [Halegenticoccus tardaugens]|uniref:DUF7322 domain-containing protein n=1 Tax=Halegenticoccus tardaugens TaxID=2071624 RepID=UPI00100C0471|nr:hypothetical protein [Halegenticoccus tardaugens]
MSADPPSDESDDPWPDEPDEPNPEARWGDPERELPSVPRAPEPRQPSRPRADAASDVSGAFWASVFFVNVGLFGLSLGALLIYFRGQWTLGLALTGGGLLALLRTAQVYHEFRRSRSGESEDDERESSETEGADDEERPTDDRRRRTSESGRNA